MIEKASRLPVWIAVVAEGGWLLYIWGVPTSVLALAVDDAWYYVTIARNLTQG